MGGLAALVDVYNPLANREEPQHVVCAPACETITCGIDVSAAGVTVLSFEKLPMRSWKDSETVTALSTFLKGPAGNGIQMIVEKDSFNLKFKPGLRPDRDPERLQSTTEAFGLLLDAMGDLLELQGLGLISPDRK